MLSDPSAAPVACAAKNVDIQSGIYILQNCLNGIFVKNKRMTIFTWKKYKENMKKGENWIKNGIKGLKIASFWIIYILSKSSNFRGGYNAPLPPIATFTKLYSRGNMNIKGGGGMAMVEMHNIYLCIQWVYSITELIFVVVFFPIFTRVVDVL